LKTLNGHLPADKYARIDTVNNGLPSKWGEAAGFQTIPDILLTSQQKLGLTSTDLVALLNVAMDWRLGQLPFPTSTTIAGRMGVVVRTVQRSLATFKKLGLLVKVKETSAEGVDRQVYDLSGLVKRLVELAKDDPFQVVQIKRREGRHAQ
jgi:hypothetical protein